MKYNHLTLPLAVTLFATTFFSADAALASGYYLPTRGAATMARGGANIVRPGGVLEALWMNPAALVDLKGLQFQIDTNIGYQSSSFKRAGVPGNEDLANFKTVKNQGGPFMTLPAFGIDVGENTGTSIGPAAAALSYNIKDLLTLAFAVQGPLGSNEYYPADGAQRYSVIVSSPVQINFQLGVGFSLHPKVDIGFILQGIHMQFHQSMVMGADMLGSEDPGFDNAILVDGRDPFTGSFALGLRVGPFGPVRFAASFSKGIEARADGSLDITFGETVEDLTKSTGGMQLSGHDQKDSILISFYIPDIYRLSVQLAYPKWDLELSAVIEDWSTLDNIYVDTKNIKLYNKTLEALGLIDGVKTFGTIILPRHWRTSVLLSLGGAYYPLGDMLALRGGFFWERGAIPNEYLDTSRMDLPKIGVATGLGITIAKIFTIDLSFAYIHSFTTTVEHSNARIIPAIDIQMKDGSLIMQEEIAAGTYKANHFTAGLSLRLALPI